MCASVYSSLLLLFTLTTTLSIFAGMRMVAEGLPILMRQERGTDDKGILAGADFLSVFMSSSRNLHRYHHPTTTTEATAAITTMLSPFSIDDDDGDEESYVRATRSTNFLTTPPQIAQLDENNNNNNSSSNNNNNKDETTLSAQDEQSSDSSLNDGVVLAVHVSSSIGRTLINKESGHQKIVNNLETTTIFDENAEEFLDQNFVASEDHPSIVAEANKSEFNVEESEPITTNSELTNSNSNSNYLRGYPASVQPLPRGENAQFHNSDFIQQQIAEKKLQPIQQTVIYHNSPRERGRARSVSYSTVIQSVPNLDEKDWDKHERHERHYEGTQNAYNNNYQSIKNESKASFETIPKTYLEASTRPTLFTTERNWEVPEKSYQRLPTVYGQPEQNYEVDESASVMTNGRVHGVQPSPTLVPKQEAAKVQNNGGDGGKKVDDNQKVGYVVEGRNYRKYRVEERTSDGFIVGEYGVVSHDDGSLRGVRYTADGTINPRLIYDALIKFLSL